MKNNSNLSEDIKRKINLKFNSEIENVGNSLVNILNVSTCTTVKPTIRTVSYLYYLEILE